MLCGATMDFESLFSNRKVNIDLRRPKKPNIAKLYLGALFTFYILPTRLLANIQ